MDRMQIRRFRAGDAPALYEVFHSAIHLVAARDYSAEQLAAWAPEAPDLDEWAARMRGINPFVAEMDDGVIVGYADVQADGYIDHFYVSGRHPRQGIGSRLMQRLHEEARGLGCAELYSHVSLTAQPLFLRHGFMLVEQRRPVLRGVTFSNALMRKRLEAGG